ncbi:acyltransferase domain-containing protein, partial [Streptomonospora algeriensis]
ARRLHEHLAAEPRPDAADIGFSLATTRTHFEHRAVVHGTDPAERLDALAALARGETPFNTVRGVAGAPGETTSTVFVFPGQGAQWPEMGARLIEDSPLFRERIMACEQALAPHVDFSLSGVLRGVRGAPPLERVEVLQPVLWAMMVALAELWSAAGVRPDAVVGHSQGEVAAACVSGALSLEDGARVVTARSRLSVPLIETGGLLAVPVPAEEAAARIRPWGEHLSVGALNSPESVVISGRQQALEEVQAEYEQEGINARLVASAFASHSPEMEVLRAPIAAELHGLVPRSGSASFHSTVRGTAVDGAELGADYWFANLRSPVLFEPTVRALAEAGRCVFIEISPHPVMGPAVARTVESADTPPGAEQRVVATLRRDEGGPERFTAAVSEAYTHGAAPDWDALFAQRARGTVDLPTYAFQHRRYWINPAVGADPAAAGLGAENHPLLGAAVSCAGTGGILLSGDLAVPTLPWLADHAVGGEALLPGTALAELALRGGDHADCPHLAELAMHTPLRLPPSGGVQVQVSVDEADTDGRRTVAVHARPRPGGDEPGTDGPWTLHAEGILEPEEPGAAAPDGSGAPWPPHGAQPLRIESAYADLAERGYTYGPAFQGLQAAWRHGTDVYAEAALPAELTAEASAFGIHPALLDAALHPLLLIEDSGSAGPIRLPFTWEGTRLHAQGATAVRVRISPIGTETYRVEAADPHGAAVLTIEELRTRPLTAQSPAAADAARSLRRLVWERLAAPAAAEIETCAILGEDDIPASGRHLRYPDFAALRAATDSGEPVPPIVVHRHGPPATDPAAARTAVGHTLELIGDWLADGRFAESRLVVATRGAVAVGEEEDIPGDLAGAALWGLVRSAQTENPGCFALVDVPPAASDGEAPEGPDVPAAVAAALAVGEDQAALRAGACLVPRLRGADTGGELLLPPDTAPWRLQPVGDGTLNLRTAASPDTRRPLAENEVRVAIRAAGLNFRDVMITLGLFPAEHEFGAECAGVVEETGPGVTDMAPGDRVMGLVRGSFGTRGVTDRRNLIAVPGHWSDEQAAATPVAYLTAYYALVDLAGVRPGERVLIHAAAGGVGQAALHLARHLGAEVFTTASRSKWPVLRGCGVPDERIADSRTVGYADAFGGAGGPGGVDVVLNSLAGEHVDASLRLLAPGGRFIEMGRSDLRTPEEAAEANPGAAYRAFRLDEAGPERIGQMLHAVLRLFEQQVLQHLPATALPARRAHDAFKTLQQGRNIGKLVLRLPVPLDARGTVLITGGTGRLGALTARHLVQTHGCGRLLLLSRRGPDAPGAAELAAELRELGAEVEI